LITPPPTGKMAKLELRWLTLLLQLVLAALTRPSHSNLTFTQP
jgi:hypothetical protein